MPFPECCQAVIVWLGPCIPDKLCVPDTTNIPKMQRSLQPQPRALTLLVAANNVAFLPP